MPGTVRMERERPGDEPGIRALLRQSAFAGAVSLTFEREPDFHLAATIEGDRHDVVVGRGHDESIVGLATRSVRTAFVNGVPARLGYLGQLRAIGEGRGNVRAIRDGFALLRAGRRPDETPFDLTSIVSDNAPARRLLEAGLPGYPTYRRLGGMVTLALVARARHRPPPAGLTVRRATPALLPAVAEVIAAHGARRQFAPCLTAEDLASPERARGLAPGDFLLAERGGRLAGCAAVWDQRAFKQAVVRGYSPWLRAVRPLLSLAGPALGLPRLPPVGQPLATAFLAFLSPASDFGEEAVAVVEALVDEALAEAARRGLETLLLGLADDDPLLQAALRRPHRPYRSTLYAVHFEEGADAVAALDGRPLGPEVAAL
jgi:hypothetical protein